MKDGWFWVSFWFKRELPAMIRKFIGRGCLLCGYPTWVGGEFCIDHWPGYDLCKACGDYRCEHAEPDDHDLSDPEFTSCHCGNLACRSGFVEGSTQRLVNVKEWAAIKRSWSNS